MVAQMLLEVLEGLRKEDFKTFKFHLTSKVLAGCKPIPKSHLEKAARTDTVDRMTQAYGDKMAVTITIKILRMLHSKGAADRLKKKYSEKLKPESSKSKVVKKKKNKKKGSSSSTAARPPPTPQSSTTSVSAQDRSVVFAPMLTSCSTGTLNFAFNTQ